MFILTYPCLFPVVAHLSFNSILQSEIIFVVHMSTHVCYISLDEIIKKTFEVNDPR